MHRHTVVESPTHEREPPSPKRTHTDRHIVFKCPTHIHVHHHKQHTHTRHILFKSAIHKHTKYKIYRHTVLQSNLQHPNIEIHHCQISQTHKRKYTDTVSSIKSATPEYKYTPLSNLQTHAQTDTPPATSTTPKQETHACTVVMDIVKTNHLQHPKRSQEARGGEEKHFHEVREPELVVDLGPHLYLVDL